MNGNHSKDRISFSTLRYDLPSGLVVFLIALPLCLGIAVASGAPPFAGLITGIIGGMVVSLASGSNLSVSGPAAGLTLIVLDAITSLGYEAFLCSVALAGIFQVILGYLRAGTIGLYFPSSVIKGMLAAIGLILIFKQIPHAFGLDKDYEGDFEFWQADGENTLSELTHLFESVNPAIIITSVLCFVLLVSWDKWVSRKVPLLPAPLITVGAGILLGYIFEWYFPGLAITPDHMVNVPVMKNAGDVTDVLIHPAAGALTNPKVWLTAVTLALVASLETLLSIEAIDKLDPHGRVTPTNRELKAQGLGNFLSGLLGGLPMTAVIVRGSANIAAGAQSKLSALIHGILLLLSVMFIPGLLNRIPFAALAIVLIVIGYKLTKPSLYAKMYRSGWDQFIPFIVTIAAIYRLGLLWGIAIGIGVAIIFLLRQHTRNSSSFKQIHAEGATEYRIVLSEEVSFLNKAGILLTLDQLPDGCKVVIDGSRSKFIDYDVLEIIHEFMENAPERKIEAGLISIPQIEVVSTH